ncbi:Excalibur calcium-binding domain-containing protein [Sphingobium sp. AP50]|nr:excalibur calcium-binding domain-containing protein [Sphingobium sp. AP50]SEJ91709.1 Excalibur calcium-binding domain-containing protein [Sphingobium sp. AP50]
MVRLGLIAGAVGLLGGVTSVVVTAEGRARIAGLVHSVGIRLGLARARAPQAGDYWAGCDSARAAGSAPIYKGEPGYRAEMDGDDDGVACEPFYGG